MNEQNEKACEFQSSAGSVASITVFAFDSCCVIAEGNGRRTFNDRGLVNVHCFSNNAEPSSA